MICTKCNQPIDTKMAYCKTKRGWHHFHCPEGTHAPEMLNRTIPFEGQALFPKADLPQYHDYPPEMLDARLYVFEGQNYVSEKDYRALLEQRRGFENAALDNETAAKKAKEQLAACRREFFEYRKVAWENEEIGHKALDDLQKAKAERDDYKCRWWRAHGELMIALGAPMTDRQNTAMKEISEIPDSKILEVLREQ